MEKISNLKISKKKLVSILSVILLAGLFIFFGVSVVNQSTEINRLKNEKAEVSMQYEQQEKTNKELQAARENENKDEYIEQKAREKGYVKSDEVVFYDISSS